MRKRQIIIGLIALFALTALLAGCGTTTTKNASTSTPSQYSASDADLSEVREVAAKILDDAYASNPDLMKVEIVSVEMESPGSAVVHVKAVEEGVAQPEDMYLTKWGGAWKLVENKGLGYIIFGPPRRR